MNRLLLTTAATAALLALAPPARAVYQCDGQTDDCQCGANNPYPCCDNGGNCTWYAWHSACCNWGVGLPGWGNANTWADYARNNANFQVLSNPVVGSIAASGAGDYGHVAWVIGVSGSQVTVREMNCCAGCNYGVRDRTYNASFFNEGFIVRAGTAPTCTTVVGAGETIIDDQNPCFERYGSSEYWWDAAIGYQSHMWYTYATDAGRDNHAYWRLNVGAAGDYRVDAFVPSNYATSQQARFTIRHAGSNDTAVLNQLPHSDVFVTLGTYRFNAGGDQYVMLEDNTGESYSLRRYVGFDAVRLTKVQTCTPNAERRCVGGHVYWFDSCGNQGSEATHCDDGNPCTIDGCANAQCSYYPIAGCCTNAGQCDDGNPCTADACAGNVCTHNAIGGCCTNAGQCDDGNPCTADACEGNVCTHNAIGGCCTNAGQCDDGDGCTLDHCTGNVCTHEPNPACACSTAVGPGETVLDDLDPCFVRSGTASYWHEEAIGHAGHMWWTYATAGPVDNVGEWRLQVAAAGDYQVDAFIPSNHATSQAARYDIVHAGLTEGVTLDQSPHFDAWVTLGTFDFAAGQGQAVRLADATGEAESLLRKIGYDALRFTPCTPHAALGCDGGAVYWLDGCGRPDAFVDSCDDGDPCTRDGCQAGQCTHEAGGACCTSAAQCDDGDPCTTGECVAGQCRYAATPGCCHGHADCDDGDPCTDDVCQAYQCLFEPLAGCCTRDGDCDDGDPCTADACSGGACAYAPQAGCCRSAADCDDGNACTDDACSANACVHRLASGCCAVAADCDDGDPCTADTCDGSGRCTHTPRTPCCIADADCDDGDPCTGDTCLGGGCQHVQVPACCTALADCDDGNPCTRDRCMAGQCTHDVLAACCTNNAECSDGLDCTADLCVEAQCLNAPLPGARLECQGSELWQVDSCGGPEALVEVCGGCGCAAGACVAPACAGLVCGDDGCGGICGVCPAGLRCAAGQCEAAPPCTADPDCDDGIACTSDRCTGGLCQNAPQANARVGCSRDTLYAFDSCGRPGEPLSDCGGCGCLDDACGAPECSARQCGDDGCGGSCGTCWPGEVCSAAGTCDTATPCWADADCDDGVACTVDRCIDNSCRNSPPARAHLVCQDGRLFAFDGCGNAEGVVQECGPCGCVAGACVEPDCAGKACGPDGCGGVCGTCPGGTVCDDARFLCVPAAPGGDTSDMQGGDGGATLPDAAGPADTLADAGLPPVPGPAGDCACDVGGPQAGDGVPLALLGLVGAGLWLTLRRRAGRPAAP